VPTFVPTDVPTDAPTVSPLVCRSLGKAYDATTGTCVPVNGYCCDNSDQSTAESGSMYDICNGLKWIGYTGCHGNQYKSDSYACGNQQCAACSSCPPGWDAPSGCSHEGFSKCVGPTSAPTKAPTYPTAYQPDGGPVYDLTQASVRDDLFAYYVANLRVARCSAQWQCETFGLGNCTWPLATTPAHVPWRNGVLGAGVEPSDPNKVGDEGGCACATEGFDNTRFCATCHYGAGPREHGDDGTFAMSACDRAFLRGPAVLYEPAPCAAPYALDPVLSPMVDGYRLCAGHGTYDGISPGCTCFDDAVRGHWTAIVPDGNVVPALQDRLVCAACAASVWGPKPSTIAAAASRAAWNDPTYTWEYADGACDDEPSNACVALGTYDPVYAYVVEDPDADPPVVRDLAWRVCGGHGAYQDDACVCEAGWALAPMTDPDYYLPSRSACTVCADDYGPPVPSDPLDAWIAARDGFPDRAPPGDPETYAFCAGPWARDPETGTYAVCAGHGVAVKSPASVVPMTKTCDCDETIDKGYWYGPWCNVTSDGPLSEE